MHVKLLGLLCFILVLDGVLCANILKKDGKPKPADEEVYGDLEGTDQDIQKDDFYDEDEVEPAPEEDTGGSDNEINIKFVSKPETFIQKIPSIVVLPCQTSSADDEVRVWSKDAVPIFQSTINLQSGMKNIRVLPNNSLEVSIQSKEDYGKYSCKLMVSNQPEIVHEIVQETSPIIVALYANGNRSTVVNTGETLTLTCEATGYPIPTISWHKGNERLGTGGETLTIQPVRAKHAGTYRCLADNHIGEPAHKHIDIHVNHAPMVSVDKYIVNSDHESDAELICEVKAYPMPVVNWQRDGQNLVNKEPKIKLTRERNNERNILIIKDLKEEDFGQYSCVATNALGNQIKGVTLVRSPAMRNFEKSVNETTNEIILQWKVESKQPITMHELQYRKKGEQSWKTISPEVTEGDNDVYLIKQTLKSLESGVYETRARSKNNHGWSDYSEILPFQGAKHGSHHQKPKHPKKEQKEPKTPDPTHDTPAQHRSEEIVPIGESKTDSSTSLYPSICLVSLTVFASYFHIRQ